MKNTTNSLCLFMLLIVCSVLSACKKDEYKASPDLVYDLAVEGNQVTFTTKTEGITGYKWDFGDGETSVEANPVHTYPGKGKYVATLVATSGSGTSEASTVIRIAKTSPVKLNDNTLSDWAKVNDNVITSGATGGVFRNVKFDYDGNSIFIYVEMQSKKANDDIFDFYIDSDNNASTGLLGGFPGGAYDILLEGHLLTTGLDIFYHTGEQTSFSFAQQSISEAFTVGTIVQDGDILKFEMSIARGKLKGLTGEAARLGIMATKSDWSVSLGSAPDPGVSGFLLNMNE
jgi:hypothetical protein